MNDLSRVKDIFQNPRIGEKIARKYRYFRLGLPFHCNRSDLAMRGKQTMPDPTRIQTLLPRMWLKSTTHVGILCNGVMRFDGNEKGPGRPQSLTPVIPSWTHKFGLLLWTTFRYCISSLYPSPLLLSKFCGQLSQRWSCKETHLKPIEPFR